MTCPVSLTLTAVTWERIFKRGGDGFGGCGDAKRDLARLEGQTVTALDCITAPELDDRHAISYTLWLLARTDRTTAAWLACDCAERVLPQYEERCPADNRPRAAIELARAWARGEAVTGEQLRAAAYAAAAYAAYAAAYAAAAAAAAYAAYAADAADAAAAAYDAAYAAAAAAAAYDAAYAADAAAAVAERHWQREHITAVLTATKEQNQ